MEKEDLTVLQFKQKKSTEQRVVQDLVSKSQLKHIESECIKLMEVESSPVYATFAFLYHDGNKEWKIPFELEIILDTLIAEFDGEELADSVRIKASYLMEQVIEALRFQHKDKFWSIGHYYIPNVEEYHLRNNVAYPIKNEKEWNRILNLTKVEAIDEMDLLFYEAENVHDLMLMIVGQDGKVLCEYLQNKGFIKYKAYTDNGYEIELMNSENGMDLLNRKTIFAREIAKFGYNIWVDFMD